MLGYQANSQWRDMSDFVVHFTKPGAPYHDSYQNMMSILGSRTLIPGAEGFGIARRELTVAERHRSVCFSEIPLDQLSRLVQRRSLYGIAFSKSYVLSQGGGPVWYVQYGSPAHLALKHQVQQALVAKEPQREPIWSMTPFVDIQGDTHNAPYSYRFDWEREWRVPGLLRFTEYDVAALLLPEELHATARGFFEWAVKEKAGPGYFCPCLDPLWTSAQIADALAKHAEQSARLKTG
ncbi:abortive infection system antitoxin AbiGi family protein [Pyxidicoccus sp. MSG2]|uniref:abortive infection system antitoxin AbiGi family protein n=1 Tax=Pyxidicoccus sp. MSG2 TaxID=2996790 RepID=UPI002270078F|nr:abortive infection system antitoxin AbiGi family protein [Pyxidicoccus sp. MSG2]MCY1015657.1 abortive infection system antitoxin AbiGi family protein [Pyxidicoccus sp. MSG2]